MINTENVGGLMCVMEIIWSSDRRDISKVRSLKMIVEFGD
jgi:hypothetical protein